MSSNNSSSTFICENNGECEHGVCLNNQCDCDLFYKGTQCTDYWLVNQTKVLLLIFSYSFAFINLLYFIVVLLLVYRRKQMTRGGSLLRVFYPVTLNSFGLCILLLHGVGRFFIFALDPYSHLNLFGTTAFWMLNGFCVVMLIVAYFATVLFWAEISSGKLTVSKTKFLNKKWTRIVLLGAISIFVPMEFIVNLSTGIDIIPWFVYVYYIYGGILVFGVSLSIGIYGFWIYRTLTAVSKTRNGYSTRLTRFIIIVSFLSTIQVIGLFTRAIVTFTGDYTQHIEELFLFYQILFRVLELLAATVLLYCISPNLSFRFIFFWRINDDSIANDVELENVEEGNNIDSENGYDRDNNDVYDDNNK